MSRHDIDNVDNADDHTTDLLKQALNQEAAMVEPNPGGLQQIHARTAEADGSSSSRRRRWMLVTPLGAGLAAAAVIFGIVVLNGGSNNASDKTPAVSTPQQHQGLYDPSAPASEQFTVWYVGSNADSSGSTPRLFPETHTVADPGDDPQLAAVRELLTSTPIDPDYRNPFAPGLDLAGIDQTGSETDFRIAENGAPNGVFKDDNATMRTLAMNAFARTAGITGSVGYSVDGELVVDGAYAYAPDDQVLAWITIDNIVDGQNVSNPVTLQVSGNVFEGNVTWALLDANGQKVDEGYTTTSQGMWTQVPVDLGTLDPGTYTFKVFELSAKDGSVINLDDKTFTVE